MLRVNYVYGLMFEWGKEWSHGREPDRLRKIFHMMVEGRSCADLFKAVLEDLEGNGFERFSPLQIGAVIASVFILFPNDETDRAHFGRELEVAITTSSESEPIEFFQGCVVGLFKATVTLRELKDSSEFLETNLWRLALLAAEKADFHKSQPHSFNHGGMLSNVIGDYLRSDDDETRWEYLEKALSSFALSLPKKKRLVESYSAHGTTRFLVGEMTYKIFGRRADETARTAMVCDYLKHRKP